MAEAEQPIVATERPISAFWLLFVFNFRKQQVDVMSFDRQLFLD